MKKRTCKSYKQEIQDSDATCKVGKVWYCSEECMELGKESNEAILEQILLTQQALSKLPITPKAMMVLGGE